MTLSIACIAAFMLAPCASTVAAATETCTFPPSERGEATAATLNRPFTCMPGSQDATTKTASATVDGAIPSSMYVDAKAMLYDMSPVATFIDGKRAKAAVISRSANPAALAVMLKAAKDEGADIALLTEEDFGASGPDGAGEGLAGAHVTAVASAAKSLSMYVVCPFRMQLSAGESYNGAVVIGRNGTILHAAHSGIDHYEKVCENGDPPYFIKYVHDHFTETGSGQT
jgi:hypothetical protein